MSFHTTYLRDSDARGVGGRPRMDVVLNLTYYVSN